MITILIAEDENKVKEILTQMLKQEGYSIPGNWNQDNIIRLIKKDSIKDMSMIKDTVIELENSLYKEKEGVLYKSILDAIEKPMIEHILEKTKGNQIKAAEILGINRNTIRTKIKRFGIDVEKYKY